ncbi:RNA-directed DNA polymerase [Winogradskyella sediminis]|uniref:Reverse transcriptase (RNA-dependent DNA polymerase) n=1 Tax=Winogradskyella sediminis TaxID=1382466 RepID=A0A1H1X828_9FLAO|nr:RNA-directed DNA polymerase [Winogradskyella sediminis]SDT05475.1 Reverse transcriptase (RNA-dependent DNA polymerase) [Winogradskyella sediminis]
MKKSTYEKCFSKTSLKLSWERVISSVGADAKDYFGIGVFSRNTDIVLEELSKLIISEKYQPKRPFKYFEPKKSGTQRTKTVLNIEDALVFQAISNHIAELEYSNLNETNESVFGSVLNKDVSKGIKLLDEEPENFYFFEFYVEPYNRFINSINEILESGQVTHILETDITGFFDTIPHSTILLELKNRNIDTKILELLSKCLNVWSGTRDSATYGVGIPQGPAGSFLIANIILDSLDRFAIKKGLHYYRFMDDIRIYGKSRNELIQNLVQIDRHLKSKSLCLNSKKTQIELIDEHNSGKEKVLDDYGISVEKENKEEISREILEQNNTQFGEQEDSFETLNSKEYIPIYKSALKEYEKKLKQFYKRKVNNDFWLIETSEMRDFLTNSQKWRTVIRILKDEIDYNPSKSMIDIWLFGIRAFNWKTNNFVWNLQLYENLTDYYEKVFSVFYVFNEYEWVQYQILSIFKEASYLNLDQKQQFLQAIPKTESPLVRLGYFKILLQTITTDTRFFQSVAELIKEEKNAYVKNSILDSINRSHFKIPIETLKNWFL